MDDLPGDGARLEIVISRVESRVMSRLTFPDEQVDSAAATIALLRIMLAHAHAVVMVSAQPFAEAGSANVRAMLEAWVDIYSILEPQREEENARRCVIFGLLEFRDHSIAMSALSADDLANIDIALSPYAQTHPALVADVELQRTKKDKRNSQYWSGTSRGELIARMEAKGVATTLRRIYKLLSWDAHHVVAVALQTSIRTTEQGGIEVGFHPLQLAENTAAFHRELASKMLIKAWLQIAKHLGVDP